MLADDVRSTFDLTPVRETGQTADRVRTALSEEGLRTTTRVMHMLAWLLNHRAHFAGDLSEFQLRRHSKLPPDRASLQANLDLLAPSVRELVLETHRLHQQIARLDDQWRKRYEMQPAAILRLHQRLNEAVSQI